MLLDELNIYDCYILFTIICVRARRILNWQIIYKETPQKCNI